MRSFRSPAFRDCFRQLPASVQATAPLQDSQAVVAILLEHKSWNSIHPHLQVLRYMGGDLGFRPGQRQAVSTGHSHLGAPRSVPLENWFLFAKLSDPCVPRELWPLRACSALIQASWTTNLPCVIHDHCRRPSTGRESGRKSGRPGARYPCFEPRQGTQDVGTGLQLGLHHRHHGCPSRRPRRRRAYLRTGLPLRKLAPLA